MERELTLERLPQECLPTPTRISTVLLLPHSTGCLITNRQGGEQVYGQPRMTEAIEL